MKHEPVLFSEVLEALEPNRDDGVLVDATVGLGGHAEALLERNSEARLVAIDRDPEALERSRQRLGRFGDRVTFVRGRHESLIDILKQSNIESVSGLLADLGVSSMQLDAPGRGFSFRRDDPLDMRMDRTSGPTAAEAIRGADERTLADVIYEFGEERHSRRIARALVEARDRGGVMTTGQLADIVRRAVPRKGYSRIDPATRTFQAIRIWVNRELEELDAFLRAAARRLAPGGRMAVIAFHSLEDRIVKHTLRALQAEGELGLTIRTKRPVVPSEAEVERNPRARSAKLRAAETQAE